MQIKDIKNMTEREKLLFFLKVNTKDLRAIIKESNYSGYSKLRKQELIQVILDICDGVKSELTLVLKKKQRKNIQITKQEVKIGIPSETKEINIEPKNIEEEMYNEMMKDDYMAYTYSASQVAQWGYFVRFQADDNGEVLADEKSMKQNYKEARKDYLKLVKYFHPDNKETGDEEKFKNIQEAWDYVVYDLYSDLNHFKELEEINLNDIL